MTTLNFYNMLVNLNHKMSLKFMKYVFKKNVSWYMHGARWISYGSGFFKGLVLSFKYCITYHVEVVYIFLKYQYK